MRAASHYVYVLFREDISEAPPLDLDWIDRDVLDWFRAQGGYQTRMNQVMRNVL
jgi:hypothetical protein